PGRAASRSDRGRWAERTCGGTRSCPPIGACAALRIKCRTRRMELGVDPDSVKGFLAHAEGEALYRAGLAAGRIGPLLEIGSYCGKSALYLGAAARDAGTKLYSIDHHRGSEEHQPGWAGPNGD